MTIYNTQIAFYTKRFSLRKTQLNKGEGERLEDIVTVMRGRVEASIKLLQQSGCKDVP